MLEHLWQVAGEFLSLDPLLFSFSSIKSDLSSRRMSYAGEVVSVRRRLRHELVEPVWPKIGDAAVCPIINFIDPHVAQELEDPRSCLRPMEEWPEQTPKSQSGADQHAPH